MALASDKRRGGAFLDIQFSQTQTQLEEGHSFSYFLSKKSIENPDLLRPVIIPALKPLQSSDLTEDMTLCPVKALRYYLDITSALRKGKNLLFHIL